MFMLCDFDKAAVVLQVQWLHDDWTFSNRSQESSDGLLKKISLLLFPSHQVQLKLQLTSGELPFLQNEGNLDFLWQDLWCISSHRIILFPISWMRQKTLNIQHRCKKGFTVIKSSSSKKPQWYIIPELSPRIAHQVTRISNGCISAYPQLNLPVSVNCLLQGDASLTTARCWYILEVEEMLHFLKKIMLCRRGDGCRGKSGGTKGARFERGEKGNIWQNNLGEYAHLKRKKKKKERRKRITASQHLLHC